MEDAHKEEIRLGKLKLAEPADLIRRHSYLLREDIERDENARLPSVTRNTQHLWVRVCRKNDDIAQKVVKTTVRRVKSHGVNVYCGLANALDGGCDSSKAEVAEHAKKEEGPLGDLQLSRNADRIERVFCVFRRTNVIDTLDWQWPCLSGWPAPAMLISTKPSINLVS